MEITKIIEIFDDREVIFRTDNFSNYECLLEVNIKEGFKKFTQIKYDSFNTFLKKYGYNWTLTIEEASYSISQDKFQVLEIDEDLEATQVHLSIFKKGKYVVIFDEEKFFEFLKSQTFQQLLASFSQYKDGIIFINTSTLNKGATSIFALNSELITDNDEIPISSICHFGNFSDYKFSPNQFELNISKDGDYLLEAIKKIHLIFNLIYLFDFSEINGNNLTLKITGHKSFKYILDIKKVEVNSITEYSKIFKWVYSEPNKIEDKLGLARNILTVYLKDDSISIEDNVFFSILSANNTYIKKNISRYIDVRTRVHSQVELVTEKVNKSVESFLSNFQKSIFVFISFYLTIFVLKIYTKPDVSGLLNKETTYMGIALLGLSFIFLLFSNWLVYLDFRRINSKYSDIKNRALDLLVQDDVKKILGDDVEYNSEKKFLWTRVFIYNLIWIITLVVFFIVLVYTSNQI